MSEFDDLSESQKVEALRGLSLAAFVLGIEPYLVLAKRGLIHPDEVETIFLPVLDLFDWLPAKLRDAFPYSFTEGFADIKRVAAANWKGA